MCLSGGFISDLPVHPFFGGSNPISASTLLLAESEAIVDASLAIADMAAKAPGTGGPDLAPTGILADAQAILRSTITHLPEHVDPRSLGTSFDSIALILGGDKAQVLRKGAYALDRVPESGNLAGFSALMAAGAAVMAGAATIPDLYFDIPDIVMQGGVASMRMPYDFWRRLFEARADFPSPNDPQNESVRRWLGFRGMIAETSLLPLPAPGATVVDEGLSSDLYSLVVGQDVDGQMATIGAIVRDGKYSDIDEARLKAGLLGLKYLLGQFPWAGKGFPAAFQSLGSADAKLGRLHVRRDGATVVFEDTGPIFQMTRQPWVKQVNVDSRQGQTDMRSAVLDTRFNKQGITDVRPEPKGAGQSMALKQAFSGGIDWSQPVVDIAAKVALAAGMDRRVLVTAEPTRRHKGGDDQQRFTLRTGADVLSLTIVNGADAKRRYAVLGSANAEGDPRYFFNYKDSGDAGTNRFFHLAIGPSGDLAFISDTNVLIGRTSDGGKDWAGHTTSIDYSPGALAQMPFASAAVPRLFADNSFAWLYAPPLYFVLRDLQKAGRASRIGALFSRFG